jgi:hypothetical protein
MGAGSEPLPVHTAAIVYASRGSALPAARAMTANENTERDNGMPSAAQQPTPLFTLGTPDGHREGSLFGLFAAVADGSLRDLPRMPAHLRAPVVTAIAGMMAALRRYAPAPPQTEGDWEDAWLAQVGADALRLIAPPDEPAFFQPPVIGEPSWRPVEELSMQVLGPRHAAKESPAAPAELWTYALLGAQWQIYGGKGQYAGIRAGLSVVLPSTDGSIGSEIATLAAAYVAKRARFAGTAAATANAADHFLWLRPWTPASRPLTVDLAPYPALDGRPVRLRLRAGVIEAAAYSVGANRIQADALLEDPHVPLIADGKGWKPFTAVKGRVVDMRFYAQALLGGKKHRAPTILAGGGHDSVRVCAIHTDPPGKTRGYWEQRFSLPPRALFSFDPDAERPADLAELVISARKSACDALRAALRELYAISGKHDPRNGLIAEAIAELDRITRVRVIETAAARLAADPAGDRTALLDILVPALAAIVRRRLCGPHDPMQVARAEQRMADEVRKLTGGNMAAPEPPRLAHRAFDTLQGIDNHLGEHERIALRTTLTSAPGLEYYRLLARVPREHADDPGAEAVWRLVLCALGDLRAAPGGVGATLARSRYAKDRASRLVTAAGGHLRAEIGAAIAWLIAHGERCAALWELATLGLADALADGEALDWARRRIALDYVA